MVFCEIHPFYIMEELCERLFQHISTHISVGATAESSSFELLRSIFSSPTTTAWLMPSPCANSNSDNQQALDGTKRRLLSDLK